jgi:hypothetical protein
MDFILPIQLGLSMLKFFQEEVEEPNDIEGMIFHIIDV